MSDLLHESEDGIAVYLATGGGFDRYDDMRDWLTHPSEPWADKGQNPVILDPPMGYPHFEWDEVDLRWKYMMSCQRAKLLSKKDVLKDIATKTIAEFDTCGGIETPLYLARTALFRLMVDMDLSDNLLDCTTRVEETVVACKKRNDERIRESLVAETVFVNGIPQPPSWFKGSMCDPGEVTAIRNISGPLLVRSAFTVGGDRLPKYARVFVAEDTGRPVAPGSIANAIAIEDSAPVALKDGTMGWNTRVIRTGV